MSIVALPSCEANVKYHKHAENVALIFSNSNRLIHSLEDPINRGWNERG